jgi:hypothetical protein
MAEKKLVQLIRPATKQTILAAWAEELKAAGLPSMEEAREKMETLLKTPEQHELQEFVSSGLAVGNSWTPLAIIENQINQWQEPTAEELASILKGIKGFRYEIRSIFGEAAKQLSKTLLHRVGGRPLVLKPDQYGDVCQEIADLLRKHVLLRDAFERVGKKYNVSARTIQRLWRNRPKQE